MADPRTRPLPIKPDKIAGSDLPKWMQADRYRRVIFTAIAVFVAAFWVCVVYGVVAVVEAVVSVPVLLVQLAQAVAASR